MSPEPFGILLLSGSWERAHYAFVLASGAAALGRRVTLMTTNRGCLALMRDPAGLEGPPRDFADLREAAIELGVILIACEAGLHAERLEAAALLPGVLVAGVATWLSETRGGQLISL